MAVKSKVMNGLIINSIVKMEWAKDRWLETKAGFFGIAAKDYKTANGTYTVYFRPGMAFLWVDTGSEPSDVSSNWEFSDIKGFLTKEFPQYGGCPDNSFPFDYPNYFPLVYGVSDAEDSFVNNALLESTGLADYFEDIKERVADIAPFGFAEDDITAGQ